MEGTALGMTVGILLGEALEIYDGAVDGIIVGSKEGNIVKSSLGKTLGA